ncbi:MAG: CBM35 domain-containing protein [Chloroflexota bacterium]
MPARFVLPDSWRLLFCFVLAWAGTLSIRILWAAPLYSELVISGSKTDSSTASSTILIQAEDAQLSGVISIETSLADYRGSGYVAGFTSLEDSLSLSVTVPSAGSYFASLRYIHGLESDSPLSTPLTKTLEISVNAQAVSQLSLPLAQRDEIWRNRSTPLPLQAGANQVQIRLSSDGSQPSIYIDFLWFSVSTDNGVVNTPIQNLERTVEIRKWVQLPNNSAI